MTASEKLLEYVRSGAGLTLLHGEGPLSRLIDPQATMATVQDAINERIAQDSKWGQQNHPDGTGGPGTKPQADYSRRETDTAAREGKLTWRHILTEEIDEAYAETNPLKLLEELNQVAAVAMAWRESILRRPVPMTKHIVDGEIEYHMEATA